MLNLTFVILCPDDNTSRVRNTLNSIKKSYTSDVICVVSKNANKEDIQELKQVCQVAIGGDTITSLMNAGMAKGSKEWNIFVFAGTWVQPNLDKKFSYFIESELDVLFPIVDRKTNFVDATLNGLMIHGKTFKKVGKFASDNPLEICKLMWGLDAIEAGCVFKAIAGAKIV